MFSYAFCLLITIWFVMLNWLKWYFVGERSKEIECVITILPIYTTCLGNRASSYHYSTMQLCSSKQGIVYAWFNYLGYSVWNPQMLPSMLYKCIFLCFKEKIKKGACKGHFVGILIYGWRLISTKKNNILALNNSTLIQSYSSPWKANGNHCGLQNMVQRCLRFNK